MLSGVTTQSFNNVFSAAYQSYQIIYRGTQATAGNFEIRVRAAGTDLTSSTYKWSYNWNISTNSAYGGNANNSATAIDLIGGNTAAGFYVIQVNNPFASAITSFHHRAHFLNAGGDSYNVSGHGLVNNTTSYDGFTFLSSALTGKVSVYGYNE